jgi:hypothetical protein
LPDFVPALALCRAFHEELIAPLLRERFPGMPYSAALLGNGSEILGYDDARSSDHHWGPRLQLFLRPADVDAYAEAIVESVATTLPPTFRGFSTNWGQPGVDGSQLLAPAEGGRINHRVGVSTVARFMKTALGFDPSGGMTRRDWLVTPSQLLLSVTAGAVYHDGLGALEPIRERLVWYPHDVWLYLIACQWRRVSQEEAFVGRTGEVGDDLGSRVVGARLVRDLMRLCFLFERRYAPYAKWFGTAFRSLTAAEELGPLLKQSLAAPEWPERERLLAAACERVAALHNRLGITAPVDPTIRPYYNRPFNVLRAERFAEASLAAVTDEAVRSLPLGVGGIDQFVDSTDVLSYPPRARHVAALFA